MKLRTIAFLLTVGVSALEGGTIVAALAQDQTFTCQAYGGAFVLDDSDFNALANSNYSFRDLPRGKGLSRQKFASLPATSKDRLAICNTRALWRAVKAGKLNRCELFKQYPGWDAELFSEPEQLRVLEVQIKLNC